MIIKPKLNANGSHVIDYVKKGDWYYDYTHTGFTEWDCESASCDKVPIYYAEENELKPKGIFPSFEDYKIEHERRSKCDFPYPTMQPHEAYMIGFNQCYQWIRHEVLKLTEYKND